MLSTAKIGTGSWRYYSNQVQRGACEYYLGVGEAPGRWQGRGLEALGLDPRAVVSERELEAVFGRALHPTSRQRLGQGWRVNGVTGYDLCFSAPKSVSALWAVGEGSVPTDVMAAHRAAVATALDYLDSHAARSRVGTDGHTQVATDGFAAAVFGHRTSRAGDPQLHSHALVVNKLRCGDGGWRTIDGTEIYRHKKSAGTVYQAALRNELTRRLNVSWTSVSKDGQAEIAGVPQNLITAWSKRTAQLTGEAGPVIAAYEAELGRLLSSAERTAVMKVAVLKTRLDKDPVDIVTLSGRWQREAAELGWDGFGVQREIGRASRPVDGTAVLVEQMDRAVLEAIRAAGARRAVFSRSDLAAEVATRLPTGGFDANLVRTLVEQLTDQALDTSDAVTLRPQVEGCRRGSDDRYASRSTLDAELRILGVADAGRDRGVAVLDPRQARAVARRRGLDGSQQAALVRIAGSGDAVSVLVAPAGTGKTTALGAAAYAWRAAGYRIVGLAPSARAAAELQHATYGPADTVAKFLHEHLKPPIPFAGENVRYRLHAGTVVIVDEASMLATADLDVLTTATWAAGAKLVLVGDPAQIGAVDAAGGMLPALAYRLGAPTLDKVHRFTETWERRASLRLRAGDPTVIDDYIAAGRVHHCPDGTAAHQAVVTAYTDASDQGSRTLMLARTHHDVDTLNTLARTHAISTGQVHGPVLLDGPMQWRAGDRLRATRNNRTITLDGDYLRNGDQFTVLGADRDGLHVQTLDGGRTATLPADYVTAHTTYGWASTIDAAQGATVDHAILLARPGIDREHLYVGLTRGRHANHVYLAQPATDIDHHGQPKAKMPRAARAMLADALSTSGIQQAAHTRLPEHLHVQPATQPAQARPVARQPRPARSPLRRIERPGLRREPDHHYQPLTHDHGLDQDHDLGRGR